MDPTDPDPILRLPARNDAHDRALELVNRLDSVERTMDQLGRLIEQLDPSTTRRTRKARRQAESGRRGR